MSAIDGKILFTKSVSLHNYGMDENEHFGDGTLRAVNYLLGKWGYQQNGIAGNNFIKKLASEINKKMQ